MSAAADSTDLYTLWKHDEERHQRQTLTPAVINAIPFRSDTSKFLVPSFGQVFYTDGYSTMKEDRYYERTLFDEEMEVPTIGTERKNFDVAETITFDIHGTSTRLPLMCKMIIYQQGATHEREPPILVRDVCVQSDGVDRPRSSSVDCLAWNSNNPVGSGLQRARSSDHLLDGSKKAANNKWASQRNRCSSMASSVTDDDDACSVMTAGGTIQHRVSHLLHRHKYQRQIDTNILGRSEFYSVPFYQYRGRRYGQRHVAVQTSDSTTEPVQPKSSYSVTVIVPVRARSEVLNSPKVYRVNIPMNNTMKHTTIGYIDTRQFVTIQRTFCGPVVDA